MMERDDSPDEGDHHDEGGVRGDDDGVGVRGDYVEDWARDDDMKLE